MQPDILADALKAGATAALTALTDAEMFANDSKHIESMSQTLYGFVKSDLLLQSHSSLPKIHQNLSTTVLHFHRTLDAQMQKAQEELKKIDPSSKAAKDLKNHIFALEKYMEFLKKISNKNLDSSEKIKALENTLKNIIAFNESYAVAKAGSYIGHYTVLLAGLVGIPALAATIAIPATQIVGYKIAKAYYEHQKNQAEQKGRGIVDNSQLSLQKIALEFLLKSNPYNKNNSPEQAAYLDALKKTIDLEIDVNKNLAAIHDYVILNEVYLKPDAKLADVNRRFIFVEERIKSLQAELHEGPYTIFKDQSHYSSSNSADALKVEQIKAQIKLLQSELTILQPIVQKLHKPSKSAETETTSDTDQHQKKQRELKIGVTEDKVAGKRLTDTGVKVSNIIQASENGFGLGGIVSPSTGASSTIVSPFNDPDSSDDEAPFFDEDPDSSDDEQTIEQSSPKGSDKPRLNPRDLLKQPEKQGDEEDEKSSRTPEPKSPSTSQKPQENKISAPKTVAEDKAPVLSKDTLKTIVTELDKYSGKRSSPGLFRSADEVMKKTASATACKLICTGQSKDVHSHEQILVALGAEKEKYIAKHTDSPGKSPFVKLVSMIEELVKQDQQAQALQQVSLTR